jgi:hypothetical protein
MYLVQAQCNPKLRALDAFLRCYTAPTHHEATQDEPILGHTHAYEGVRSPSTYGPVVSRLSWIGTLCLWTYQLYARTVTRIVRQSLTGLLLPEQYGSSSRYGTANYMDI